MFNGAYMITSVNHTISPGFFETTFKGTRQRVFSSERPNNYLLSLNKNLVQKLVQTSLTNTTEQTSTGKSDQTSKKTNDATNSCQNTVTNGKINKYKTGYSAVNANATKITVQEFANKLRNKIPAIMDTEKLKTQLGSVVFAFSFVSSANEDGTNFESFGNNYGNVDLLYDWTTSDLFLKEFCCVKLGTDKGAESKPFARFDSVEKYMQLMGAKVEQQVKQQPLSTKNGTSFLPTADALFNLYVSVWSKIQGLSEENFKKNQGAAIREKINKSLPIMESVFGKAGFQLVSSTTTTTTTSSGQQVNPNLTTNADDRTTFSSASPSSYRITVTTLTDGSLKLEGNIGSKALSKEYKLKLSLITTGGISNSEINLGETTLKAGSYNQINGFSFTTPKAYRETIRNADLKTVLFAAQVVEYPEYKYNVSYKVMQYDCPPRNLKYGDVTTQQVFDQIEANPCGICYPNGGRRIIINGKECLPNTAPAPRENIYDTVVNKDASGKPTQVIFTIKPNVGIWQIFTGSHNLNCDNTIASSTDGSISTDRQKITFEIQDIIDGCGAGAYTVTLKCVAQPYLANGQVDPGRSQTPGSYVLQGQV